MAVALIDELGGDLERTWRSVGYELAAFPRLCAERLQSARLHERIDPGEIVRAVFEGDLPQQCDPIARFGQPPVTLFRSRRFYIASLFWVDGTTTIHDHAFSGAFQVLSGQSIETNFSFAPTRDFDGHVRFGELRVESSALRWAGDVRAVPAGPGYIHSLFHLARPSVSLVVRTYRDPLAAVQLDYSPAGIAFDPFLDDPIRDRMVQTVDMLRRTEHLGLEGLVGDLLAASDLHTSFSVIRACMKITDASLLDRLVGRLRDAEAASRVREWVEQRRRADFLTGRRAVVFAPPLRFLLAVLLNAQCRADALALVASHTSDVDPARQVAEWLRELSKMTIRLQVGHAPFEPSVLGLPPFGPGSEEALADLLAGRTRSWSGEIQMFLDRLRALPALRPLFVDGETDAPSRAIEPGRGLSA